MSVLIKNGRIITAHQDYVADVFIEEGQITMIGSDLNIVGEKIIDASGKYVIPGGVDVHTHLDMPLGDITSSDDFETGTRAAAFGGTTCIVDFATQNRGQRMRDALDLWWKKGEKATLDYGLHMIITDLPEAHLEDMTEMVREGVTSFKFFMAYPKSLMIDDGSIFRAMQQTAKNGGLVLMHAENGGVIDVLVRQALADGKTEPVYHALTRPTATEAEAVHRTIALAEMAEVPVYIVHVSCADALNEITEAQRRGLPVLAETCPQYLFLSRDDLSRPNFEGAKYVLTPPLREKWHQEKLWEGLCSNALQVVSTDHCPFNFRGAKERGRDNFTNIPNGGPGVENRLQLLFHYGVNQKRISVNRWVDLVSTSPAKIFGMYPRKGTIAVGSDADLVVWDPNVDLTISATTHHMRVDYSMYEGFNVRGNAETVLSRGEVIVQDGQFFGRRGRGKFVKRDCYAASN